ncbi:hypothetical protein QYM36_016151 [Artemia franciscana]|uniref:Uncharacterized protein n=1 Tax=Artemia franciscana TaxID=6661 RepID=A0AA88H731_ARTSF|nr:hypothetical protein QYM36_016151 [Artemia franciscana]
MNNNDDAGIQKNLSLNLSELEFLPNGDILDLDMVRSLCCDGNPKIQHSNNGKDEKIDVFENVYSDSNASIQNPNSSKDEKPNGLPPVPAKMKYLTANSDTDEASSFSSDEQPVEES